MINQTQSCNLPSNSIHSPYSTPETYNMRYMSIIAVLIFSCLYLFLRFLLPVFKTESNQFFTKGIKIIANQTILFFICMSILLIIYTYGILDTIQINWQYLIAALAMFGFGWILFGIIILAFSILVTHKWNQLETDCKDNFSKILITI